MLRRSSVFFPAYHNVQSSRIRPHQHKYKEVNRWQRQAMGLTKWDQSMPHRKRPMKHRFNPESNMNTKGTSSHAYKWWFTQSPFLPQLPPDGYVAPEPTGRRPNAAWDDVFTSVITKLSDQELQKQIWDRLTLVIHEESQRDGYELRQLDFEGRPLEDVPGQQIIKHFILEEETIRDRVLAQVVETDFRLTPTSSERRHLKTVDNIVDYIVAQVTAARSPPNEVVPEAVKYVLSQQTRQPELGFHHALPEDNRDPLLIEWERLHQHDWQFGKAVYTPRSEEKLRGNLNWLREDQDQKRRNEFSEYVKSGRALEEHKEKIRNAQL